MIYVSKEAIQAAFEKVDTTNEGFYIDLQKDIKHRKSSMAIAYFVKAQLISFPNEVLKKEVDEMVEESLISIAQWEQMNNLLQSDPNGNFRVSIFLKKRNRFVLETEYSDEVPEPSEETINDSEE